MFINSILRSSDFKIFQYGYESVQNSPGSILVNIFMHIIHVLHEKKSNIARPPVIYARGVIL